MALVTVIIPAYNSEATVPATLRSALAQTHNQLEVFVVDDGSQDLTAQAAGDAAAGDPRVTLIRQANSGVGAARNRALARARGAFTAWLDADDIWHPRKIEKQLAVFAGAKTPLSFVYTGYRLIDPNERILPNPRTLADVSGQTLCMQIATNFFSNVSSIMVPTTLARRFGGHDPRLRAWGIEGAEDLLLQLHLADHGPAGCCREALVGYRMHDTNMSRDFERAGRSILKVLDLIEAGASDVPPWVFGVGRARVAGFVLHLMRKGEWRGASRLLARLMTLEPRRTLLLLALIMGWQGRTALGGRLFDDPAIGLPFCQADPETVPWHGHMVLTRWHQRRLERADAERTSRTTGSGRPEARSCDDSWLNTIHPRNAGGVS